MVMEEGRDVKQSHDQILKMAKRVTVFRSLTSLIRIR